ncbi:MAG: putative tRNA modification GTPase TrmE, partial [Gemmatimonadota bacterium]
PVVTVSAETGEGLDTLLHAIDQRVSSASPASDDDARITRERHRLGISTALDEVRAFRQAWGAAFVPAPIAASHLLTARDALSELLGTVDTEEILGRVFRDFCIGK